MIDAFIGLGANIGDPEAQLLAATEALTKIDRTRLRATSRVYRSAPLGPQDQPDFLNACAHVTTKLSADALLSGLQAIEKAMGRVKLRHWGERCIDLDLLLFGDLTCSSDHLTLPHPGVHQRSFVLLPLQDLLGSQHRMPSGDDIGTLLADLPGPLPHATSLQLPASACSGENQ